MNVKFCNKQLHRKHAQCRDNIIARSLQIGVCNLFHCNLFGPCRLVSKTVKYGHSFLIWHSKPCLT